MNDQTDSQLLQAYAENRSEAAFTELVRRHVDLVYSAARRMVCDPHLAEDVTQGVFVAFAKNARHLTDRSVLSGWLHRTAQNIASQTVRTIERRRAREQEAFAMNELIGSDTEPAWDHIAPHLDAALGELSEPDRDALMLRYFERKSAREMAQTLGVSDEAAQRRVSRAVERLRERFAKQGFALGANGLVAVISANAVQAAPVGLTSMILKALAGTTIATTTTVALTTGILMTTLQKALITATIIAVGVGIYEAREISSLRNAIRILQQQDTDKLAQLTSERDRLLNEQATSHKENERLGQNATEVLQLRGKLGVMQRQLETQVAAKALPTEEIPAVTNAPAVYSARVQTQVKWDHAVVIGGWKLPSGKRLFYFAEPKREKDASQLLVKFQNLECSEAAARVLGLESVLTDNKESQASHLFTSKQYTKFATPQAIAQAAAVVPETMDDRMLIMTKQIAAVSGRQIQTRGGEGTLDVLPTITADGESVDMVITIALTGAPK